MGQNRLQAYRSSFPPVWCLKLSVKKLIFSSLFWISCFQLNAQINLNVGDSVQIIVPANIFITPSKITVARNEVYDIKVYGEWVDAGFPATDANGFPPNKAFLMLGRILKRMPLENYMMLCASINKSHHFSIGTGIKKKMRKTGLLNLYPNDAKGFFENNEGEMQVIIKRVE